MRSRRRWQWRAAMLAAALLLAAGGCGSGASQFIRDDVDLSFVRRVAVYPFYNLSQDVFGGQRVQSVFLTELLARGAVEVVDRGEMLAAIAELKLPPDSILSPEQVVALGGRLGAEGIFFGSVEEYGAERGAGQVQVVTATYQLCEAQTGRVVWSSQARTDGTSLMRRLFGGGSASGYDVARANVRAALGTLF